MPQTLMKNILQSLISTLNQTCVSKAYPTQHRLIPHQKEISEGCKKKKKKKKTLNTRLNNNGNELGVKP
jgi:hypothetical protein